jgi:membrane fusion protein, multidrug efflux system
MGLNMSIRIKKYVTTLFLIIAVIFAGCNNEAEVQEEVRVPVRAYKVQPESLTRYIILTGTITAAKDQVLFSKVSERISRLYVKPGDRVSANQKIAEQYNAILTQGLDAARANAANAEAQFELAQQNYDRIERLHKQRAVSTQQFEQVTTQLKAARSAMEAAQAQLEQGQEQLENSIIKSPFSGVVAAVFIEENQMVPAGQQVAQVIDPSTMKSKVRISGRDISFIKRGQDVVVSISSIPDKNYKGRVVSIDQAVDPVSKTLEAEIIITDADTQVKSGMYGEFKIAVNSVEKTIVVPETALLSQTEVKINRETGKQEPVKKYFLFTVKENKAVLKEVNVGLSSEARVQITNGLSVNDTVIVVGNNVVQNGQTVNIID